MTDKELYMELAEEFELCPNCANNREDCMGEYCEEAVRDILKNHSAIRSQEQVEKAIAIQQQHLDEAIAERERISVPSVGLFRDDTCDVQEIMLSVLDEKIEAYSLSIQALSRFRLTRCELCSATGMPDYQYCPRCGRLLR